MTPQLGYPDRVASRPTRTARAATHPPLAPPAQLLQTDYTGRPGSGHGAPSAGAEAHEMLPTHLDPATRGAAGEEYRRTTDNKGEPRPSAVLAGEGRVWVSMLAEDAGRGLCW